MSAKPSGNGAAGNGSAEQLQGRGIRDQIRRYRASFIAVITMVVLAIFVGGYVLSNERLSVPSGVPLIGQSHFILKAYLRSAQALTPGQGQAVTIAGAKIGEIEAVELRHGLALVTMALTPRYARIYRDATLLVRPKTPLQEMTVEVDPGDPSSGRLQSGATLPVAQTSPNVNFDQFLETLDGETRAYLQALLAAAAEGLHGNGRRLAAVYRRFDPLARNVEEITKELSLYHRDIAGSIHNFSALLQALGEVEKDLAQLVENSNHVFRVFVAQDANVQRTLQLLPAALAKTDHGLGKLATAAHYLGPTLAALHPFASELAPAERASIPFLKKTTPIIRNEIRPFTREARAPIEKLGPASRAFAKALPGLTISFTVFNEIFNELAYNPGRSQGGFLFFADWAAHNVNSSYASADANGALGNTLLYFNCSFLTVIEAAARQDATAKVIVSLLNLPHITASECRAAQSSASAARATAASSGGGG
ncbi:MAG TPA: MlaD family protein [Solirubrobacteraceae bacterium]|nr:MlaD family protein [Solirubrobacteraceae bacterium]